MSYKTIRDLAAQTGVTESALRYYDEKRLLQPTVKSQTGRREWLYDDEAVRKLKHILLLKRIGLSVEDIAGDDGELRKTLIEKLLCRRREGGSSR